MAIWLFEAVRLKIHIRSRASRAHTQQQIHVNLHETIQTFASIPSQSHNLKFADATAMEVSGKER
jgi:hypothetical protein